MNNCYDAWHPNSMTHQGQHERVDHVPGTLPISCTFTTLPRPTCTISANSTMPDTYIIIGLLFLHFHALC